MMVLLSKTNEEVSNFRIQLNSSIIEYELEVIKMYMLT